MPDNEECGHTIQRLAARMGVSTSLIKRAISWGLVRVLYFGDRPIIPPEEVARVSREGLPRIPRGYRRKTRGPVRGGRPGGSTKAKAKGRLRSEARAAP